MIIQHAAGRHLRGPERQRQAGIITLNFAVEITSEIEAPIVESEFIIGGLGGSWDWDLGRGRGTYLNVASYIGDAMRQNSGLHVFVAAGYYDFATPFHGAEYSLNRSGIIPERVHFEYYESGHMMYVHHPSLAKLLGDVRSFITRTLAP